VSDTEGTVDKRLGGFLFSARLFEEGSNEDDFLTAVFIRLSNDFDV